MKRVLILGATGSIGRQTLDVVAKHPDQFSVAGLSAHHDENGLLAVASRFPAMPLCLSGQLPGSESIRYSGDRSLERFVEDSDADIVVNAVAGAAGLEPTFAAINSGKDVALANKETIVMAGRLVLEAARDAGIRLVPVDSEHAAIFSMVERFGREAVRSVIITASGGAFRDVPYDQLESMRPADALAHPTWNMGAKITVDSASMANKGLEVIEAARLFNLEPHDIDVVVHPESRVHSFIRTRDGSLYAQISKPDMRLPIMNALSWPAVLDETIADLPLAELAMSFYPPDPRRYPLLGIAYEALAAGEGATSAYNAANEIAVAAFMEGRIRFTEIARVVGKTLEQDFPRSLNDLRSVHEVDQLARHRSTRIIEEIR